MSLAESSVTATARLIQEVLWVGMWKDLYCFALRINMVLPDWRGIIGLGLYRLVLGPIDLKLAAQPHILKGTSSREQRPCLWCYAEECVDYLCMVAVC